MAGDWIKIEHVTPDKPEIHQIAEILGIDSDAVVGKLMRFWIWADQQAINGNAIPVTKNVIDRITYVTGFADALLKVDWLQARSGSLAIPHFDRHNGQTSKLRAETNRRVAKHREKRNADDVTSVTQKTLQKALPEKRREDSKDSKLDNTREEIQTTDSPGEDIGKIPTVEDCTRYAASLPMPAPRESAIAFHDTQSAEGWITRNGHPIADWRAAYRRYLSRWIEFEKSKATKSGAPPAKRQGEYPEPTKDIPLPKL